MDNNNNRQWDNQGGMPQQTYSQQLQYNQQPQNGQPMMQQGQYQQQFQQPQMPYNAGTPKQPSGNQPKSNKGLIIGLIVVGVLLIAAIVTIIILVVKGKDTDKKETTEWISEPTVTMTEEPTTTEEPTEAPTTEEIVTSTVDYSNYYEYLNNLRYGIDCYYWQFGYSYSGEEVPKQRPVAFTDITGDGIDEMLIMHAADDVCAELDIYTITEDGTVAMMYTDNFDVQVAGGTVYYLFKTANSEHLYAYTSISDEWTNGKILEFNPKSSTQIETIELATFAEGPNEDYTELIGEYTVDGKACTVDEFNDFFGGLKDNASEVVMYNRNNENDVTGVAELLSRIDDISMSYSDAVTHVLLVEDRKDGSLPIAKPINLTFSSGAGAWSTDIVLSPDGTFTGSYHDANMGESGDGYESTIYYCNFEGKFKNITMVDATTCKMELETLTVIEPTEDQKIEDDICYIKGEPYGISGGTIFDFYLPGIKVSTLPSEYVSWVWGLENSEIMENFGLYNIDMEQGFANY